MNETELAALNRAVALADGWKYLGDIGTTERNDKGVPWCRSGGKEWWLSPEGNQVCGACEIVPRNYAGDGAEAMRLLEKHKLIVGYQPDLERGDGEHWYCDMPLGFRGSATQGSGPTPAVAICRAVVRLKGAA